MKLTGKPIEITGSATFPGFLETYTRYRSQQVNAIRPVT